jgi:sugar-specific transcriptional regulator TrmB
MLAAVATALALLATGCGGGGGRLSKQEYEQKLQAAAKAVADATTPVTRADTKEKFKDAVAAFQEALENAADELDKGEPPEDVENANARLVAGFRRISDQFDAVAAAADRSLDAAVKKGQELNRGPAAREAAQALLEIQRRGYSTGSFGG